MNSPAPAEPVYKGRLHKPRRARLPVDLWCEIQGDDERAIAHLRNLTVDGCRAVSPCAFPVKGTLSVILTGAKGAKELDLRGLVRWLHLDPAEGLFELGVQFVHAGDSARRIEQILRAILLKKAPLANPRLSPSFASFTGGMETRSAPGSSSPLEQRKALAAEGLARLTTPVRSPSPR